MAAFEKMGRDDILKNIESLKHQHDFIAGRDELLAHAVGEFDSEYAEVLIEAGANPNLQASWGDSLLHSLAHRYMSRRTLQGAQVLRTARALLSGGANPNMIGCNNLMPINICMEQQAHEFEALLLEFGADPKGSHFA